MYLFWAFPLCTETEARVCFFREMNGQKDTRVGERRPGPPRSRSAHSAPLHVSPRPAQPRHTPDGLGTCRGTGRGAASATLAIWEWGAYAHRPPPLSRKRILAQLRFGDLGTGQPSLVVSPGGLSVHVSTVVRSPARRYPGKTVLVTAVRGAWGHSRHLTAGLRPRARLSLGCPDPCVTGAGPTGHRADGEGRPSVLATPAPPRRPVPGPEMAPVHGESPPGLAGAGLSTGGDGAHPAGQLPLAGPWSCPCCVQRAPGRGSPLPQVGGAGGWRRRKLDLLDESFLSPHFPGQPERPLTYAGRQLLFGSLLGFRPDPGPASGEGCEPPALPGWDTSPHSVGTAAVPGQRCSDSGARVQHPPSPPLGTAQRGVWNPGGRQGQRCHLKYPDPGKP